MRVLLTFFKSFCIFSLHEENIFTKRRVKLNLTLLKYLFSFFNRNLKSYLFFIFFKDISFGLKNIFKINLVFKIGFSSSVQKKRRAYSAHPAGWHSGRKSRLTTRLHWNHLYLHRVGTTSWNLFGKPLNSLRKKGVHL